MLADGAPSTAQRRALVLLAELLRRDEAFLLGDEFTRGLARVLSAAETAVRRIAGRHFQAEGQAVEWLRIGREVDLLAEHFRREWAGDERDEDEDVIRAIRTLSGGRRELRPLVTPAVEVELDSAGGGPRWAALTRVGAALGLSARQVHRNIGRAREAELLRDAPRPDDRVRLLVYFARALGWTDEDAATIGRVADCLEAGARLRQGARGAIDDALVALPTAADVDARETAGLCRMMELLSTRCRNPVTQRICAENALSLRAETATAEAPTCLPDMNWPSACQETPGEPETRAVGGP